MSWGALWVVRWEATAPQTPQDRALRGSLERVEIWTFRLCGNGAHDITFYLHGHYMVSMSSPCVT